MGDITMESHPSSVEGIPSGHRCISGDSLVEWRSSDQVENGNPSTSPSYWDTDDDDHGLRPSDLYGNFTWTIDGFSQISKRELRSNVFDVGGYKWYILIYPQGCDVCNHLSLFLCVANHDKLLPGWSHFAQFTIAVANKDSKKSKYSDTLHRFWKKEHDWGWKKFMELSKVSDGFLVDDALKIKAQVQVIRENAHQPFRCLDCQYRRELVRVYLSNVEKLCRRYVEEKKSKFIKIIEDKVRWSSFHAFWLSIDHSIRRRMSRDKSEAVLKVVVKHFFIENEVTSTLVMDYLYSGLKALEYQSRRKNGVAKLAEIGEMPDPFVFVEKDVFFLTDDVLLVLERAALEPLPPKDDKGSQNQNRLKECSSGDDLESIELDERRLTELGRRTVEMFALNHIYSMIEIAYQEAVSLRRQEELIREEEAAGQAESELRSRRNAAEKEKRTKKKQVKQKKNSRKTKDKGRSEKSDSSIKKSIEEIEIISSEALDESPEDQTSNIPEECNSPVAATDGGEMNQPESEERETSPTSWDTDASDAHLVLEARSVDLENNQTERKKPTLADDRPSTWSTESVLSIKDVSSLNRRISSSRSRRKNQQSSLNKKSQAFDDTHQHHEPEAVGSSMKHIHRQPVKEEAMPLENQPPAVPEQENLTSEAARSKQSTECQTTFVDPVIMRENPLDLKGPSNGGKSQTEKPLTPDTSKSTTFVGGQGKVLVNAKNVVVPAYQASNSPLAPKHRPPSTPLSSARPQAAPLLSRSVSAAGRLSVDPSQSTVDRAQSYRNAIMGRTASMAAPKSTVPALTFGSVTPEKLQSSPLTQRLEDSPPLTSGYHLREDYPAPPVHQLQAQGVTQDEFPHIDIINDLLNEENSGREVGANGYFPRSYSTSNERYFFAGGASTAATPAASVDDNYIFTLGSQLYEQLILRETGSFGRSIVGQRAQSSRPFDLSTGYMTDGSAQKQWLPGPARQRHSDNEFFYDQDYLDMVRVMNGFDSKFHPSNGH